MGVREMIGLRMGRVATDGLRIVERSGLTCISSIREEVAGWVRDAGVNDSEAGLAMRGCFRIGVKGPETRDGAGISLSGRVSSGRRRESGVCCLDGPAILEVRFGVVPAGSAVGVSSDLLTNETRLGCGITEPVEG